MKKKVSILIPCYNEEKSLPLMYQALCDLVSFPDLSERYDWEWLFVNDGSTDHTLDVLRRLRDRDSRVCYIDLSRNFGKENAMLAGFDYVTGDCMIIMDADLQHPPALIPQMLEQWEQGYDDVYAKRLSRGRESWLRRKLSLFFYSLLQHSTRVNVLPNVGDFRLLDRKCVSVLRHMRESQRYTKGMYSWIGFRKTELPFEQQDRVAGTSSWNFMSLFNLAIDGINIGLNRFVSDFLKQTILGALTPLKINEFGVEDFDNIDITIKNRDSKNKEYKNKKG